MSEAAAAQTRRIHPADPIRRATSPGTMKMPEPIIDPATIIPQSTSPRPRTILDLQGDAGRGEKLFWSQALQCGSCHKVGDRGKALGPDLSAIGKLRSREDLLKGRANDHADGVEGANKEEADHR